MIGNLGLAVSGRLGTGQLSKIAFVVGDVAFTLKVAVTGMHAHKQGVPFLETTKQMEERWIQTGRTPMDKVDVSFDQICEVCVLRGAGEFFVGEYARPLSCASSEKYPLAT